MTYAEWFRDNKARAHDLAGSFPVTVSAVYQWANEGVPLGRMQGVEKFTRKAVRVQDMVAEKTDLRRKRAEQAA